jgi:Flp pilus assembly protein TadB
MSAALSLPTIVELVLAVLLAATLFYCVKLERGLRRLRGDQESLNATLRALNGGIGAAQASLAGLRAAAKDAGESLGGKVTEARALIEELSLLTSSGERAANRIEHAIERQPARPQRVSAPALSDALRAVR